MHAYYSITELICDWFIITVMHQMWRSFVNLQLQNTLDINTMNSNSKHTHKLLINGDVFPMASYPTRLSSLSSSRPLPRPFIAVLFPYIHSLRSGSLKTTCSSSWSKNLERRITHMYPPLQNLVGTWPPPRSFTPPGSKISCQSVTSYRTD